MTVSNFQQHVTRKETYATEILRIIRLRGKLHVSVTNITFNFCVLTFVARR